THGIDEGAAELPVLRRRAQRPAHRVDDTVERPRDLPHLLHAERPDLRVLPAEGEAVERDSGEVALRALRKDGDARQDVGARLEVAELLPFAAAALVAGADTANASVRGEQSYRRRLRQDHRAAFLGLVREPATEAGQRRDD